MAGNEVTQQAPRAFPQLSNGMNSAGGRMVYSFANTFDVGVLGLEPARVADIGLKSRAVFAEVMPITGEICPVTGTEGLSMARC